MEEKNPLHFSPHRSDPNFNKSGRPKNKNLIKFTPQPRSLISQMLNKIKKEKDDQIIPKCDEPKNPTNINDNNECDIRNDNSDSESSLDSKDDFNIKPELASESETGKDPLYPCNFPKCNYISKLSSNLIKHKRTHTMEKPYLCDLCSFRSNFVNSLKVHRRTHTNERPYSCQYCTYRCNSSSNLKKHCKHRHLNIPPQEQSS